MCPIYFSCASSSCGASDMGAQTSAGPNLVPAGKNEIRIPKNFIRSGALGLTFLRKNEFILGLATDSS
jgi:hypothetical protein